MDTLPRRTPPRCKKENRVAWKVGEKISRKAVLSLKKLGLLLAFISVPDDRGGVDHIAILIDGSFVLVEDKNFANYYVGLSPYQFTEKVLDRYWTVESVIKQYNPKASIHRVLQGNIPLSPGAIALAETKGVFLNVLGYKVLGASSALQAVWPLKRQLRHHVRQVLGLVVSRTKHTTLSPFFNTSSFMLPLPRRKSL